MGHILGRGASAALVDGFGQQLFVQHRCQRMRLIMVAQNHDCQWISTVVFHDCHAGYQ